MWSVHGIKETKEAVVAVAMLTAFVMEAGKDGYGLDDAIEFAKKLVLDPKFKEVLKAANAGKEHIASELADVGFAEGVELLMVVLPELQKIFKA
jgi:urease gamma subunit